MTDDFVSMTKKLNCAEVNDQTTTQTTTFTSENMSFIQPFDFICVETANCMQVYLNQSKCIFMYLSDRGGKIQKDTFRYVVSKCIFSTRVQRYKKMHLDTWYL